MAEGGNRLLVDEEVKPRVRRLSLDEPTRSSDGHGSHYLRELSADAVNRAAAESFMSLMKDRSNDDHDSMLPFVQTLSKAHPSRYHDYDKEKIEAIKRLDYRDIRYQAAYMYLYFPTITHTIKEALGNVQLKEEVGLAQHLKSMYGDTLNMCAVGGGPGTDVLGLYMYMAEQRDDGKRIKSIKATVLEKYPDWNCSWEKLHNCLNEEGGNITIEHIPYDAASDAPSPEVNTVIGNADVITMIKLASSKLLDEQGYTAIPKYKGNLIQLLENAKAGSLLVIGDNNTKTRTNLILDDMETIAKVAGFVATCPRIEIQNPSEGRTLPGDNNPLREIRDEYFGTRNEENPYFWFQKDREMDFLIMQKEEKAKAKEKVKGEGEWKKENVKLKREGEWKKEMVQLKGEGEWKKVKVKGEGEWKEEEVKVKGEGEWKKEKGQLKGEGEWEKVKVKGEGEGKKEKVKETEKEK